MASTPPSTSSSSTPLVMDPAALRSCVKCHRRMSSLKYDSHTLCSECRVVVCNLTTHCDECKDWSSDFMSAYLQHKKSLATKRGKKPASASAPGSSLPAVTSSQLVGSPVRLPSFADFDRLKQAVVSTLQNLSQSGSLGINPFSFSAPLPVPDSAPHQRGATGGDGGHQPHTMGGPT